MRWVSGPPPHSPPLLSHVHRLTNTPSTHYTRAHSQKASVRMLNQPRYLSAVVPSRSEPTPTSWLSRARCFFFDGRAPWSPVIPPRHLRRSCTASLWHGIHQAASKQRWPLQNITSAISVWIHTGGLCLWVWGGEQERVKRQKGRSALKLAADTYTD